MKCDVVVRSDNACFAPFTVVVGSDEAMRSDMKDCADGVLPGGFALVLLSEDLTAP